MKQLTVLYDEHCPVCVRSANWLAASRQLVPLLVVPSGSPSARESYGRLPWLGRELVVVSDEGAVWAGPAAFLICFWALAGYRWLALLASTTLLLPISEWFFTMVSAHRGTFGEVFFGDRCDGAHCGVVPKTHPYR